MQNTNSEMIILLIVAVIFGAVIVYLIVYYLLRFLKGSIKLTMPTSSFNSGEVIKGSVELRAKKPIQGNKLTASLIGTLITVTRSAKNSNKQTRREFYRNEILLEEATDYPAGTLQQYDFEIPVPEGGQQTSEFMNSDVAKMMLETARLITNSSIRKRRIDWKVQVELDAKGVDLSASKKIRLNIPSML